MERFLSLPLKTHKGGEWWREEWRGRGEKQSSLHLLLSSCQLLNSCVFTQLNKHIPDCVCACVHVCVWVREGVRCREKAYVQMNSIIRLSCRPLVDGCRNRTSPSPSAGMSLLTAAIIFPASVYVFLLIISGFFCFSKGLKVFPLLKAMLSFVSISMSVLISPSLKPRSPIV